MDLKDLNDNVLSRRWEERYSKQPPEIQKKLDELDEEDPEEYQLKVIKRKRIIPKTGDVFLVNPIQDLYFYGIVLNDNINNCTGNGLSVIMIFKCKTREKTMDNFILDFDNILIGPCMVAKGYWSKGYFYNIACLDSIKKVDYGFCDVIDGKYYDEYEVELKHNPKYLDAFGISTLTGIAYEIKIELIIDNSLLE